MARLSRDVVETETEEASTAAAAEQPAGADHSAIPEATAATQSQHEPAAVASPDEPASARDRRPIQEEPELNWCGNSPPVFNWPTAARAL